MKTTYIFGHKNPDTDSVTAAISLSYLKNKQGMNTVPMILGEINKETEYALNYFNIKKPDILEDVKVQINDVPFRRDLMMSENASIYEAYTYMVDNGLTGLPIVHGKNKLVGYVSLKEIAADFIKGDFDSLNASYENVLRVLNGEEVLKFHDNLKGKIMAVTFNSEIFISESNLTSDTIVIVGSRRHIIDYCIDKKVMLIVLIGNQDITEDEYIKARENGVSIIKTPKKAFEVAKLIGLSNYIKNILKNETPVTFTQNDFLTEFFEISNKLKHTNYPIVDLKGRCHGMLRLIDVNKYEKKDVILVDHNDIRQSVNGLNEATILEIVDHHALGNLTTSSPISFRNMIVGSTNTIIYELYRESVIEIPKSIAGAMLSGILSDTLILKSPTTTEMDRKTVEALALIAEVDYKVYGMDMLKAGSSLRGLSLEDIVYRDYKEFQSNNMGFGIGQVLTLDFEQVLNRIDEYVDFLTKTAKTKGFNLMALFITDIINEGSYVIYSDGSDKLLSLAFNKDNLEQGAYLKGIISRKKQIVPNIMGEFDSMD